MQQGGTQMLVVLVGVPASGKTWFAQDMLRYDSDHWALISHDALGSRAACEAQCVKALQAGLHVIIDHTNLDETERSPWLRVGYNVCGHRLYPLGVVFNTPLDSCLDRLRTRPHKTIDGGHPQAEELLRGYATALRPPHHAEGFYETWAVADDQHRSAMLGYLLRYNTPYAPAAPPAPAAAPGAVGLPATAPWGQAEVPAGDGGRGGSGRRGPKGPRGSIPFRKPGPVELDEADRRVIVLFDFNGTITSHTSQRNSTGNNRPRPGAEHLLRMVRSVKDVARIGVYSSASDRTVETAIRMLERAAGCERGELFDPALVLTRRYTQALPQEAKDEMGGDFKEWDTWKPLGDYFPTRLHRVVLVDDDIHKSLPTERGNLVLVPSWDGGEEDGMLAVLVGALQEMLLGLPEDADVRERTAAVTARLQEAAGPGRGTEGGGVEMSGATRAVEASRGAENGAAARPVNEEEIELSS
ncbi:unnamed protein product [Pedinophyceae sp. YPF-701]|nr:unnamed protein product [Pedinophyceae sp. YPF-701]